VCVFVCITNVRIDKSSTFVCLLFVSKSFPSLLWTSQQQKPREARFCFLDSVTVNTVVHTESEACQKQWCHRSIEQHFCFNGYFTRLEIVAPNFAPSKNSAQSRIARRKGIVAVARNKV